MYFEILHIFQNKVFSELHARTQALQFGALSTIIIKVISSFCLLLSSNIGFEYLCRAMLQMMNSDYHIAPCVLIPENNFQAN